MFTIDQIRAEHAKMRSGADFPCYIQDITKLGVAAYTTYVKDGHTIYSGEGVAHLATEARYAAIEVAKESDTLTFKHALKIHQQGQTDYMTFCHECAETGVEKWIVDTQAMTCTYFDSIGNSVLIEEIPLLQ